MKNFCLLFIMILCIKISVLHASILVVPRQYPTIQSAIDSAAAGDTIEITAGTYTTSDTINKPLTIIGAGDATIIAPLSGNGFTIISSNVSVRSIAFSTAPKSGIEISALNGAISNITIGNGENVKFFESGVAGIFINGNVDSVTIHANFNITETNGAGILITGDDSLGTNSPKNINIENTRFSGYSIDDPAISLLSSNGNISNETVFALTGNYFGNQVDEEDVEEMIVHTHDFPNLGEVFFAYKITTIAGEHGETEPDSIVPVLPGNAVTIFVEPDSGYHVDSLFVNDAYIGAFDSYTFVNVTAHKTFRAAFRINSYFINASIANAFGTITPSGNISVIHGMSQIFTITPLAGYHIDSIVVDGDEEIGALTEYIFSNVIEPHTIQAYFSINTYTITPTADNNGEISPEEEVTVFNGFNKLFTFIPNEGYHAANITIDGESTFTNISSYEFINVRANHTIAVTFALNTYRLNIAVTGNGTVQKTPDQETYSHGSYVHLAATPDADWEFTGWSGNASGTRSEIIIEMNGEKNVYAIFSDLTLLRTFSADTKLGAKPVRLKFKNNVLAVPPNYGTVLEALFDKIGKNGKTFLGIEQTDPQKMKMYAWIFYKKASELQKLFSFVHTGQAYPLDTLRKGMKYKKLSKALKPDKSFNNTFLEQAMGFKINLIASEYQILPKGLGELVVDTTISLAGHSLKDSSLNYVGSLLDSVMTYWQDFGITDIGDYIELGTFSEKFLRRVNEGFSDELVDSNYYIDTSAVVNGKKSFAMKLWGTKRACDVCIVKKGVGKNSVQTKENTFNTPSEFSLEQNYPNPFNPQTTIGFSLLAAGNVSLKVYDILGQEVVTLVNNEAMMEGNHEIYFDGSRIPSGVYFYNLNVGEKFSETKKLVVMK